MTGETGLRNLLKHMHPVLQPEPMVFATVAPDEAPDWQALQPLASFRESEGWTVILPQDRAEHAGLIHAAPMRQITLTVHSSLEAVGLTAAISAALTREGISANVVAAYFHDHVFVPEADALRALETLKRLAAENADV